MDEIARGAEAVLFRDGDKLVKLREPKAYRLKQIDDKLRKLRTRGEARIIGKAAAAGVDVPKIIETDEKAGRLVMEFVDGTRMKETVVAAKPAEAGKLFGKIGEVVGRLHNGDICHGDLTTSNMILSEGKLFLIDFGLAYFEKGVEGKAVDLRLLRQALESTHWNFPEAFDNVLKGYRKSFGGAAEVEKRLEIAEARGRYNRRKRATRESR